MEINNYNDLTSVFSNDNNNKIDTMFTSSQDHELGSSCLSYYVSDDHMYGTKNSDLGPGPNEYSTLLDLVSHNSGRVMGPQVVVDPSPTSSVLITGDSSSEVLNTGPTTPNSISISSSSSEAAANEGLPNEDGDGDDNKSKKLLKAKKKEKKKKEPRFAFMTKTDVDQLDDGYRWRKYGQKAVKNSPFPRSYYRCTTAACGVKKRVERSSEDPSIVVTTYEGQHDHPCPIMTRGGFGFGFGIGIGTGAGAGMRNGSFPSRPQNQCSTAPVLFGGNSAATSSTSHDFFHYSHDKYHQQHQFSSNYTQFYNPNCFPSLRMFTFNDGGDSGDGNSTTTISCDGDGSGGVNIVKQSNPFVNSLQLRHIRPPYSTSNSHHQPRDDGLLQDIVPSQMRNEATREV